MNDYRDNLEIDLKDLVVYILRCWKIILVFAIVGCVLGGSYGFYKNTLPSENSTTDISSIEGNLSEKEIIEVQNLFYAYQRYKEQYDELVAYREKSVLMAIDDVQTPTARKTYLISNYEQGNQLEYKSSDVENIVAIYKTFSYEDDVANAVVSDVITDTSAEYVKELYSISLSGNSIMEITAVGRDREEASKILNKVSEILMSKSNDVQKLIPHEIKEVETTFELVTNVFKTDDDSDVSKKQAVNRQLFELSLEMMKIQKELNTTQKNYFVALSDTFELNPQTINLPKQPPFKSIIKYMTIGMFMSVLLLAFMIAVKYILTPTLKTEDDIRRAFQIPIIGTIRRGHDNSVSLVYSEISAFAKKTEAKNFYLVSSSDDEVTIASRDKIRSMFDGKELSVLSMESMLIDPIAIDEMVASDGVVLFERIGKSFYEDIAREIELCKNLGVQIIGTVIIK